jgi:hypothetical protein
MARVNEAWTTPATGIIARDSTEDCQFCSTTEDRAAYLVSEGHRYADDPVSVSSVEALSGAPTGQVYLTVDLVQNPTSIVESDGTVVGQDEKKVLDRNVALKWVDGRWLVYAVEKTS